MSVAVEPAVAPVPPGLAEPTVLHLFCLECRTDKTFCGIDRLFPEGEAPEGLRCAVCEEMIYDPCPYCGVSFGTLVP